MGDGELKAKGSGAAPKEEPEASAEDPVQKLSEERDRLLASLQRTQADFQNFRARAERERAQWREETIAETLLTILPALDNLERALAAARAGGTLEALTQGVSQVVAQVERVLSSLGISKVAAEGKSFDPKFHEVLCEVPAPEGAKPGEVVSVVEAGYQLHGRVIRPARVTVARAKEAGG